MVQRVRRRNNSAVSTSGPTEPEPKPFVLCLYSLVSDPSSDHVICWDDRASTNGKGGTPFTILDNSRLQTEVIPRYFKHANFLSFVRQLNHYAFVKISKKAWTFGHPHFVRNRPDLLAHIERKQKKRKPRGGAQASPVAAAVAQQQALRAELTAELQSMREQQDSMFNMMANLRREVDEMHQSRVRTEKRMVEHMESIGVSPAEARLIAESVQKGDDETRTLVQSRDGRDVGRVTWGADVAPRDVACVKNEPQKRRKLHAMGTRDTTSAADWANVCDSEAPGHTWATVCGDDAELLSVEYKKVEDTASAAAAAGQPAASVNEMFRSVHVAEPGASTSGSAHGAMSTSNIKAEPLPESWDDLGMFPGGPVAAVPLIDEDSSWKYGTLPTFDVETWMDDSLSAAAKVQAR